MGRNHLVLCLAHSWCMLSELPSCPPFWMESKPREHVFLEQIKPNETKQNYVVLCGYSDLAIPFSVIFRNFWNNVAFPFIMERKAAQGLTIWLGIRLVGTSFQQDVMIFVMPALLIAFYFSFLYRTYLNNFISREYII